MLGQVPATGRKGFMTLSNKLDTTDGLIGTKLDRLGGNVMDVRTSVEPMASMGVHYMALGGTN